jgi:hypothetical protein
MTMWDSGVGMHSRFWILRKGFANYLVQATVVTEIRSCRLKRVDARKHSCQLGTAACSKAKPRPSRSPPHRRLPHSSAILPIPD